MKKICVFCGSNIGYGPEFEMQARKLASSLNKKNLSLVYGGGSVGLMGIIANELLELGGEVTGVIPHFLVSKEVDHKSLTKMIKVDSIHERKQTMSKISDAFIAMPGGLGTLEELAEILTWSQLGLVDKPIGLLNVRGFFDSFINMLDEMVKSGFLKKENREMLQIESDPDLLLNALENYKPAFTEKWMDQDQT